MKSGDSACWPFQQIRTTETRFPSLLASLTQRPYPPRNFRPGPPFYEAPPAQLFPPDFVPHIATGGWSYPGFVDTYPLGEWRTRCQEQDEHTHLSFASRS